MKKSSAALPFITGVIADGGEALRPVQLQAVLQRFHKYQGCKSAGCRTFKDCICSCKDCKRWCIYRGATAVDVDGKVTVKFANGKLRAEMKRHEYDEHLETWKKIGVTLVESPRHTGVTP